MNFTYLYMAIGLVISAIVILKEEEMSSFSIFAISLIIAFAWLPIAIIDILRLIIGKDH